MTAGRPTDYRPDMCERVIELGKEGKSRAELASALDCSRATMAAWERQHPEFLNALQRAADESLAWWEAKARGGIETKEFNSSLWGKCMSGRFPKEPYRERVQLTGANDGPVQTVDLSNATPEQLAALEAVFGPLASGDDEGDPGGEGQASGRG